MNKLKLKVPPLILTIVFGIFIILLPNPYEFRSTVFMIVSVFFTLCGVAITLLAVIKFKNKNTTVNPMNPQDSNALVIEGIYKYTRNPMYLGFLVCLLSLGLYLGNLASIILSLIFVIYMNVFQIIPEEKVLLEKFGEDYENYKKSVRRWI